MTELIAIVAVAVVAWFAAGTIWNIRKGRLLMRWMQDGLPVLGARTTVRWLGSSAVEMAIRDAKAPFGAATLIIFLEPRDMPWMWALSRSRGRRDILIVRGALRATPIDEFEVLDPGSWSGRDALPRVPSDWKMHSPAKGGDLAVHSSSADAVERVNGLLEMARRAGLAVKRLSVRRTEPNFQLHVTLPTADERQAARAFFEAIRAIAERACA